MNDHDSLFGGSWTEQKLDEKILERVDGSLKKQEI